MSTLQLSADTPRCWWCGRPLTQEPRPVRFELRGKPYDTVVCSPEHERALTDAYRYIQRFLPVFWIGLAVTGALFITSAFVRARDWLILAGFCSLGLTIILCPFATPQTVEMFGLRRALLIVRILGMLCLAFVLGFSIAPFLKR